MADATTTLQPLQENAENESTTVSMAAVGSSPPPMVQHASDLKLQLFELLKSANIEEAEIKEYTTMHPMQKLDSIPTDQVASDGNNLENQLNSHYDKQILLEEAEMIHRLQEWIEKKGKPAIQKVHQLTMKTDQYEHELSSTKLELKALRDEIGNMHNERHDLQSQYEAGKHRQSELVETIDTLQLHTERDSNIMDIETETDQKISTMKQEIDTLKTENTLCKTELEHLRTLNEKYMEQNTSLKIEIETKDEQIKELTKDRDQWQNNTEIKENALLERLQLINKLNASNANYKQQIDLLRTKSSSLDGGKLTEGDTLRGLLPERSTGDISTDAAGDILAMQKEKSDVFFAAFGSNAHFYNASVGTVDFNKVHNVDAVIALERQLKDERIIYETELESLRMQKEEMKKKVEEKDSVENKYKEDIKGLNEEIESLKNQNGGCNSCILM